MTKMQNHEMKSVMAGAPAILVMCICDFMDGGMDYDLARRVCQSLFP